MVMFEEHTAQSSRAEIKKHIVFDWNSTLLDDFPIIHDCMNHVMERFGKPSMTMEHFQRCYEVPFENLYTNLGLNAKEVEQVMHIDRNVFHDYYEPKVANAPLRDGAAEILRHVRDKGLGTYILSNHIVEPIKGQLKRLGIDHFFDEVLAYATRETQFRDMTKGERLRRYRAEHGIDSHEALIVGDSVEEIEIAHQQNMISVAITGGGALEERLRQERPDYVIHSLHELKPILKERGFVS